MDAVFRFSTILRLQELTGQKARDVRQLLDGVRTLPGSVIYHHTHHFLEQHQYLSPEPPNDFAYWVTQALNEAELGERLASINTVAFSSIRELREKIAQTLEDFLKQTPRPLRESREGSELHFIKAISFVLPTPYSVTTLEEFASVLRKITIHSLYFHMFEAKLRLEKGSNDFSVWLEALGEKQLASKIARMDPYTQTMEGLREKIIQLIEVRLNKKIP